MLNSIVGIKTLGKYSLVVLLSLYFSFCFAQQKHIYLANDNHTDYFWSGNAAAYVNVALNEIDYYLDLTDSTLALPVPYQNRYNLDGAWYAYTYKQHRTPAQFERLINRIKSGHISVPYNFFVSTYGGQPTEAILRGMYWPGLLERRNDLDINLAVSMENQTLPLGLSSLWAGSGAKYSWKGVCGCSSPVSLNRLRNRDHEIYHYRGLDGTGLLMKWYSLSIAGNQRLGGYAEARSLSAAIAESEAKCNSPNYPYDIAGAFGHGWDDLQTLTDVFPGVAQSQSDSQRQIYVSNESDFFEHFETAYNVNDLPAESLTYGNDWDIDCASMAATTSRVRLAVEKLRTAEAMASVVSRVNPGFYAAEDPLREQAWVALGSYWEHNFGVGGCCANERGEWELSLHEQIENYVNNLFQSSKDSLTRSIRNNSQFPRFFVFNPLGWSRTDIADVAYPGGLEIEVIDLQADSVVPHQAFTVGSAQHLRILAENVPSVGYKIYEIRPAEPPVEDHAATLEGNVFENLFYRLTVTSEGVITSLVDKFGNEEYVQATNGRYLNDFGQGDGDAGELTLLHSGPVSTTIACTSGNPLQHTTFITLYKDINRIEIDNRITDNFGDQIRTYSFSFNLDNPELWHEELGAVIKAKYTTNGGHYAPPGKAIRHDWQTLNHFADIGSDAKGVTLSNEGAAFMKLGNSSTEFLDESSGQINVLIGGRMAASGPGLGNQFGLADFPNSFALRTRSNVFNATESMKFALEHQNPMTAGMLSISPTGLLADSVFSLLTVPDNDLLLWALKPAEEGVEEGGFVMRLWNLGQQTAENTIEFAGNVLEAVRATHVETDIEPAIVEQGRLVVDIGQQKMETFRVFLDTIATGCSVQSSIDQVICEGETFEGYSQSGLYTDFFTAANGCDSIRILDLTVLPTDTLRIEGVTCDTTTAGVFVEVLTGQNGCDSVVVITVIYSLIEPNLEVQPASANVSDGTASVSPSGGQEPYLIEWSNGEIGLEITGLAPGFYAVTVTDANGCRVSIDFEVTQATGLWEIPTLRYLNLNPNPASDQLGVEMQFDRVERGTIILHDYLGREVYREEFDCNVCRSEIDVSRLAGGVYQVRILVGKQETAKKAAIQKKN
jgi:alpha-mannosidase